MGARIRVAYTRSGDQGSESLSGLVGIIANDSARYSLFSACVTKLQAPEGTRLEWLIGGDWCGARNTLVEMTLEGDHDWLWFMDDDHAFPPNFLLRLLEHDQPLVVPVCLQRVHPFRPCVYLDENGGGEGMRSEVVNLHDQPETGLIEIAGGGTAGMLIRREVLEAVEPPWFEYGTVSEDLLFCDKAKEKGFKIHCDLALRLGHITTAVVWPAQQGGEWVVGFNIGRDLNLFCPIEP